MRIMYQPVQDRICHGFFSNDFMPAVYRQLGGNDHRSFVMPVLDYFHQNGPVSTIDRNETKIIDYKKILVFYFGYFLQIGTVGLAHLQPGKEFTQVGIIDFKAKCTGLMPKSGGNKTLSDHGAARDDDILMLADVIALGKLHQLTTIQVALGKIIDAFHARLIAEPGIAQPSKLTLFFWLDYSNIERKGDLFPETWIE
jgi:hypothetical protein